jgi:hypothetical protein
MGVPGPLSGVPGRPLRLLRFPRGADGAAIRERSGMVRCHRGEDRYKTDTIRRLSALSPLLLVTVRIASTEPQAPSHPQPSP